MGLFKADYRLLFFSIIIANPFQVACAAVANGNFAVKHPAQFSRAWLVRWDSCAVRIARASGRRFRHRIGWQGELAGLAVRVVARRRGRLVARVRAQAVRLRFRASRMALAILRSMANSC